MADDKLFHFLVTRVQSREVASLTMMAIAASASLVLLAFSYQINQLDKIYPIIFGYAFPSIAIAYNELTYFTIHGDDHKMIRQIIKENNDTGKDTENIILGNQRNRKVRRFLTKLLLFSPMYGWTVSQQLLHDLMIPILVLLVVANFGLTFVSDIKSLNVN